MVTPMQEVMQDDQGNRYVREGNRWRVERAQSAGQPSGQPAAPGYRFQPIQSGSDRRAEQDQAWQAEDRPREAANEQLRLQLAMSANERANEAASRSADPYAQRRATGQAEIDVKRMDDARQGWQSAGGLMSNGNRALSLLDEGAATGPFADLRLMTGKALGGALGFLPGIPNASETRNLEQLRNIGSQGALADVGQLKGPLSEKELAFIQRLQLDPNATEETNRVVAEAMRWTARRQAAYGAALQRWDQELGSPSAVNAEGLPFEAWWGRYSAQALPRPGTPEAEALSSWQAANPGREAAVVSPPAGVPGGSAPDPASGQQVAQRGRFNPETGEIEWQ